MAGGALSLVAAAAPGIGEPATDPAPDAAGTVQRLAAPSALPTLGPDQVLAAASMAPIAPEPDVADAGALVKAVQRVEEGIARAAEEARLARERAEAAAAEEAAREAEAARDSSGGAGGGSSGSTECGLSTSGLGAVKSWVEDAAQFLGCQFGQPTMLGVGSRGGSSDHPSGKALDLMTRGATGDAIAACALDNMDSLGVTYVIWEQRINHGSGWKAMEDRGGDTANHMDHVHISFNSSAGGGSPRAC